jgi:hypothetical protein
VVIRENTILANSYKYVRPHKLPDFEPNLEIKLHKKYGNTFKAIKVLSFIKCRY